MPGSHLPLLVLGLCFAMSLLGRGAAETFTVFLLPVSTSFGWDRAEVVSIYSLAALATGVAAPFVGRLFDRSGPRTVFGLGLFLLGTGFLSAAFTQKLWQLQVCIGLAAGLGSACLGNVAGSLLLSRWFGPRLPTAMAVVYSAAGAGILLMVPLSQILIDHFGWRGAYRILGAVLLGTTALLLVLPWQRLAAGSGKVSPRAHLEGFGERWTLLAAMHYPPFWTLFSTFLFTAVGVFALSVQVVAYLIEAGFSPLQAATAWGFSGVLLLLGILAVSWLDALIGRRRAILLSYSLTVAGIGMLWLVRPYPSVWLLYGFLICFGGTIGSRGPLVTAAAMSIFRGKNIGTIFGTISIGSGLGAALGSWAGGLIHDWSGGYDLVIAFTLASVLVGMIAFLLVPTLRN
jgi:MFS family permease